MNIVFQKVRKGKGKRVGNIILWQSGSGKKGNEAERKRPVYRNASAEFCCGNCKSFFWLSCQQNLYLTIPPQNLVYYNPNRFF